MSSEIRIQARAAELCSARVSEAGFRIAKAIPQGSPSDHSETV
ncbi:MAG: hypothetical protein PGN34_00875 [Methylobacterium frigidaeris]